MIIKRVVLALVVLQLFLSPAFFVQAATTDENFEEATVQQLLEARGEALTTEELKWFATFQEGTFYARGWREITAEILEKTPPELREKQRVALEGLGVKIGCEWSKDNDVRKIDTKMLQKWGEILQQSAGKDPDHVNEVIVEIEQNVNNILN